MTGFKDNTLKLATALGISSDNFDAVGIHEWPTVMRKIEKAFVVKENSNTKFNWWWESFKGHQYKISFEKDDAFEFLHQLINEKEKVWFVGCDTNYDPSKFWLFQGYVGPIQKIIGEQAPFEYYIVSKKYEWLISETEHGVLIGLGTIIPKMKELKNNVA